MTRRLLTWVTTAPLGRALVASVLALELVVVVVAIAGDVGPFADNDADIYVAATRGWWAGGSLYDYRNLGGFGFTYPPFAALVVSLLAWLPGRLAGDAFQVAAVGSALLCVAVVLRADRERPLPVRWLWCVLSATLLLAYPVFRGYSSGQIDLVLILAVTVDVLLLARTRWAGVLIGVAIAVKLTPAVFLLLFLATGRWRALGTALATALACTGLGWLANPAGSREFWTERLWDTSNVGAQTAALNQSLAAVVARFTSPVDGQVAGAGLVAWLVLVVVLVAAAWVALRHADLGARATEALVLTAVLGLLVSPISWLHHWAWLCVFVPFLCLRWLASGSGWAWALGLSAFLASIPPWWLLGGYFESLQVWRSWGNLVGSVMVWWGLALFAFVWRSLTAAAARASRRQPVPRRAPGSESDGLPQGLDFAGAPL